METTPPEERAETGRSVKNRSVLVVRKETRARLDQLMKETNSRLMDDVISFLLDRYDESRTTAQPSSNQE